MKTQKIKRYRRSVSRYFPKSHPRAGEPTYFVEKILRGLWLNERITTQQIIDLNIKDFDWDVFCNCNPKLHTCREALELWIKIIDQINAGTHVVELFYWSEKPYRSPQVVFVTLDKDSGCGVQELSFYKNKIDFPSVPGGGYAARVTLEWLSKHDGLSLEDFKDWFKGYDLSQPMAIIQFAKFRY